MNRWTRWRDAWVLWMNRHFKFVLVLLLLLPSATAHFWGPGWGVVIGIGAALVYSALAGDSGWGEQRWLLWGMGINLILFQMLFLLYLMNQVQRPRLGAG